MDLKRCLEILNLKNATSQSEIKHAYRELVNVWHPDRFPANSQLKEMAEKKIKEINLAYEKLRTFLSSEHGSNKLAWLNMEPVAKAGTGDRLRPPMMRETRDFAGNEDKSKPTQIRQRPAAMTRSSGIPRTSSYGKYVVFGFLIVLGGISGFIINYISKTNHSTFEAKRPNSILINKLISNSEKTMPAETKAYQEEIQKKTKQITGQKGQPISSQKTKFYEIHLKDGGIIIVDSWWEKDDMIMYKTGYGTIGIEKSTVAKIISR